MQNYGSNTDVGFPGVKHAGIDLYRLADAIVMLDNNKTASESCFGRWKFNP